jgi:hypothetical protein
VGHELTHVLLQRQTGIAHAAGPEARACEHEAAPRPARDGTAGLPAIGSAPRSVQRLRIDDCSPEESPAARFQADVIVALGAIDSTIGQISADALDPLTLGALTSYFGARGLDQVASIASSLRAIAAGLQVATFACAYPGSPTYDSSCIDSAGVVFAATEPTRPFGEGRILLCEPQFGDSEAKRRMSYIVHEGAHRFLDAEDRGYFGERCAPSVTQLGLGGGELTNADSYGCLVEKVGLGEWPYTGPMPDPL